MTGPLLLLAMQISPINVHQDSKGQVRLTVGYGTGRYVDRSFSCAGNLLSSTPVPYNTYGARVDYWPAPRFRLSGFAGATSLEGRPTDGPFGGVLVAAEGQSVGIGIGVTGSSIMEYSGTYPAGYLRLGSIDHAHFRFDLLHPSSTFGTTGLARIGVGFNAGLRTGTSGFFGLAVSPSSDQSSAGGPFAEIFFPVQQFDLGLRGFVQSGSPDWAYGGSLSLRYNFRLGTS
jgi:hypothetical protein